MMQRRKGIVNSLHSAEPIAGPLSGCASDPGRHISQWSLEMPIGKAKVLLFGCAEDVACGNHDHIAKQQQELETAPYVCRMCPDCAIPVCHDCWSRLYRHVDGGTIPNES